MKRLKGMRSHYERVPPLAADIEALQHAVGNDPLVRDRERWRPVLVRILALANEVLTSLLRLTYFTSNTVSFSLAEQELFPRSLGSWKALSQTMDF